MSPRASRPWFRLYTEAPSDPKLRRLAVENRWLFVCVLGLARMSCRPGTLLIAEKAPARIEDIADYAGMDKKKVESGMAALSDLGLVVWNGIDAWFVPNWDHRQFESDDSTKRGRLHRAEGLT